MANFEHKFFNAVSERHNGEFRFVLRPKSKWHWHVFRTLTTIEMLFKCISIIWDSVKLRFKSNGNKKENN